MARDSDEVKREKVKVRLDESSSSKSIKDISLHEVRSMAMSMVRHVAFRRNDGCLMVMLVLVWDMRCVQKRGGREDEGCSM